MNNFALLVEFQVRPEALERFHELIRINATASVTTEPGCFQFDVVRSLDDSCRVLLYEVYRDEDAFKTHIGMSHTQTFLEAAKPLVTKQTVTRLERVHAPPRKA